MKQSKKKLLLIAYYFPPHIGPGVQRPLRLVNNLMEDGWDVHVISSESSYLNVDISLKNKIPIDLKIDYLDDLASRKIYGFNNTYLSKLFTFLAFPDRSFFWYLLNKKKVNNLLKQTKYDICITTSRPYSSHLFGLFVKKQQPNITWIVDYRDAWSNNPSLLYNKLKPLLHLLSRPLEKYINGRATYITTVSEPLMDDIIANDKSKISVLYNGYDPLDFSDLHKINNGEYVVFFMGQLYSERNPEIFLSPFVKFVNTLTEEDKKKICLSIIGDSPERELNKIKKMLPSSIKREIKGYLEHEEILSYAQTTSLLLLLIDDTPGARGVVTGKIFEYINLFAPILGIVPLDGVAAEIINKTNTGKCCAPKNAHGIQRFFENDFQNWKKDPLRKTFLENKDYDEIAKYSRNNQYNEFKVKCLSEYNETDI